MKQKNKETKKINLGKVWSRKQIVVLTLIFLLVGAGIFVWRDYQAKGATFGWMQRGWSGGVSATPRTHSAELASPETWTNYASKDTNVTAGDTVTLNSSATSVTDTNTTPDFEAGTSANNNVNIFLRNDGNEIKIGRCGTDSLTYAGETYPTVVIGTQCWLAKNLNVGTMVTGTTTQTNNGTIEKYCYNNNTAMCTGYGGLYQWNEAMGYSVTPGARGICPSGWHIPTDAQQYILENYLQNTTCLATRTGEGCSDAGTDLKLAGGFNGLLAGVSYNGSFFNLGVGGVFWSSSVSSSSAWYRSFASGSAAVSRDVNAQTLGYSVRCLKD